MDSSYITTDNQPNCHSTEDFLKKYAWQKIKKQERHILHAPAKKYPASIRPPYTSQRHRLSVHVPAPALL